MFGCYRKAEASDPEIYAAAVAAVLDEYPRIVVDYVTDPRTGLPSSSKWLPSVFEVREACDTQVAIAEGRAKLREIAERNRRILDSPNTSSSQKSLAASWLERAGPRLKL